MNGCYKLRIIVSFIMIFLVVNIKHCHHLYGETLCRMSLKNQRISFKQMFKINAFLLRALSGLSYLMVYGLKSNIYIVESAGRAVIVSKCRIISSNLRNLGFHIDDPTNICGHLNNTAAELPVIFHRDVENITNLVSSIFNYKTLSSITVMITMVVIDISVIIAIVSLVLL